MPGVSTGTLVALLPSLISLGPTLISLWQWLGVGGKGLAAVD